MVSTNNKKRILLATTGLSSVINGGGISAYVHDLATNLAHAGYDVTVFLIRQMQPVYPIDVLYSYKFFEVPNKRSDEAQVVYSILKAIRELAPEVIINNDTSYIAGLYPVLDEKIVRVSVIHGFNHSFDFSTSGVQGKMAVHNWEYIDYIVCQNESMVQDVARKYSIPLNKVKCIPQTATHSIERKVLKSPHFTIGFGGGARLIKGAKEMYRIAKILQKTDYDFKLVWCLPAKEYEGEFKNDKRFIFTGRLSRMDFLKTVSDFDCIVIPTKKDTGPMLLVEALSLGVVPICNNLVKSAIPDIIKPGINGFTVERNEAELYLNYITRLMETRDVADLSDACFNYFNDNLAVQHQISRFESLFQKNINVFKKTSFSNKNVVHFHLHNTTNFSKYSLRRLFPKIVNACEVVLTEVKYKYFYKYFLK